MNLYNKKRLKQVILLQLYPGLVLAGLSCSEVQYGSPKYQENMEKLAISAHLQGNFYNRYQEDYVGAVCKGDAATAQQLIDVGSVSVEEGKAINQLLGIPQGPSSERSDAGRNYADARQKMSQLGLSEASSDNVAMYFAHKPTSECALVAKKALGGDQPSISTLRDNPSYCVWDYQ